MSALKFNRGVLRFHGIFLIFLTVFMIISTTYGLYTGKGPGGFLYEEPFLDVGLFQAYGLMFVIGLTLVIGSYDKNPWKWDVIGLLAHVAPLIANFMFVDFFAVYDLPKTIPLHGFFITLELVAIIYYFAKRDKVQ
ncbi:hypothetical protein [Halobacillus sp. K22]|uniref:hypothetical protein n=1 Tax=Halobacillus sp. K22 TaxID=3457431 RepID=UPI003FCECB44